MLNGIFKKNQSSELEMKTIYELFYKRVFRDAYFVTRDIHLAQDILQETFIKAFRQLDSLQDKEKMGAWLSTIATRTAIDYIRKENRMKETEYDEMPIEDVQVEVASTVEDIVEYNLILEDIINKIMELKEEYRGVLLLRYIHELAQQEIAELTDLNVGTVKSRLHRATKALKVKLIKDKTIGSETLQKRAFFMIYLKR